MQFAFFLWFRCDPKESLFNVMALQEVLCVAKESRGTWLTQPHAWLVFEPQGPLVVSVSTVSKRYYVFRKYSTELKVHLMNKP